MLDHFQRILDVADALEGRTATTWNINRQNELVVMTISKEDEILMREVGNALRAPNPSSQTYCATLWRLGPEGVRQCLPVTGIPVAFPKIQGLSDGRFVLVGGRCRQYTGGDPDENCVVVDSDGNMTNQFCVGDAVLDVQVGAHDSIWVSYFDEGAIFNRAWSRMVETSGLMKFHLSGKREWSFPNCILDCCSLNVTRDATWLCYFTDFPIARVARDGTVEHCENEFRPGCKALSFWGQYVLLAGGYGDEHSLGTLVVLKGDKTVKVADFDLGLAADVRRCLTGRGHLLHYVTAQTWWTLDMRDLL